MVLRAKSLLPPNSDSIFYVGLFFVETLLLLLFFFKAIGVKVQTTFSLLTVLRSFSRGLEKDMPLPRLDSRHSSLCFSTGKPILFLFRNLLEYLPYPASSSYDLVR